MAEQTERIDAVFVYGTLKRGQCRESLWPVEPREVLASWVRGTLFGRADYPALMTGTHRVCGELWGFHCEDMPRVLEVLDAIEGTSGNSPEDLYHRRVVDVFMADCHRNCRAYTYFYNRDPLADRFTEVPVFEGGQSMGGQSMGGQGKRSQCWPVASPPPNG